MVDKNSSSSLLEAIKNKLNKFDKKPLAKPDYKTEGAVSNIANYFTADINAKNISQNIVDKTSINIDLKTNNNQNNSIDFSENSNVNKSNDFDLDDESLNVKSLSSKIAIESKIKEIAGEITNNFGSEEFEDAIDEYSDNSSNKTGSNQENIDPVELELQKLEQEILAKKQHEISASISNQNSENDLELKNYLDQNLQKETDIIDKNIAIENLNKDLESPNYNNNITESQQSPDKQILSSDINAGSFSFDFLNNPNRPFSPARDFLAKIEKLEENSSAKVDNDQNIKDSNIQATFENNPAFNEAELTDSKPLDEQTNASDNNISLQIVDESQSNFNKLNKDLIQDEIIEKTLESSEDKNNLISNLNQNIVLDKSNKITNDIQENKSNENSNFINQKFSDSNLKIDQMIDHKLIHQETIYQANESIKKLIEAKNMIKSVNNYAQNDILNKIAISLMEPKLEKWLNDNLPSMVEEIVRQEIDKIIPKD